MADNTAVTNGAGDVYRSKDRAGVKTDIVGIDVGIGGTEALLSTANPLPIVVQAGASAAAAVRPDSVFRVATEPSALLYDTFDAAADVLRWTVQGTVPPTQATGTLTVSAGTVASAWSAQTSVPYMRLTINSYLTPNALIALDAGLKTGSYRFVGLGILQGSPTAAAPFADAVGFEWLDTTGVLSGVVWSGGARTQSVSLSAVQPSDTANHRYLCYYKSSKVYFEIDGVSVGSIAYPAPQLSNMPMVIANINGLSTVSPAAVMTSTFLGVADSAGKGNYLQDATYPDRRAKVGKAGALAVMGAQPPGQTLAVTASTPVTGTAVDASEAGNVTFVVKNTVAATAYTGVPVIVFEQSDDGVSWAPLPVSGGSTVSSSPVIATGAANVEQMFDAGMEGVNWCRVRVTTAQTANGMTVVTQFGGMPFSPSIAVAGTATVAEQKSATATQTGVAASATSVTILASNAARKGATVANDSISAVLYLRLSATAATAASGGYTVMLVGGGYYEVPFGYTGQIVGIWVTATGFANVSEMT